LPHKPSDICDELEIQNAGLCGHQRAGYSTARVDVEEMLYMIQNEKPLLYNLQTNTQMHNSAHCAYTRTHTYKLDKYP